MKIDLFVNRNIRNEMKKWNGLYFLIIKLNVIDIGIVCDRIIGFRFRRVDEFIDDG